MKELINLQINLSDNPDLITFSINDVLSILNHIEQLEHKVKMLSL